MKKHLIITLLCAFMLGSTISSTFETAVSLKTAGTAVALKSGTVEKTVESSEVQLVEENKEEINVENEVNQEPSSDLTVEDVNDEEIDHETIENTEEAVVIESELYNAANELNSNETINEIDTMLLLEKEVKEACLEGKTEVDISDYSLADYPALYCLQYFSPYLNDGYSTDDNDQNVITITVYNYKTTYAYIEITNPFTPEQTQAYFNEIDSKVNALIDLANERSTDLEKALVIHDYFAAHYQYDRNYANFSASDLIYDKTAVCQGYAYAYQYIMNAVGIECYVTTSDTMNHAWNIININGNYYHVDNTYDDPTCDCYGQVRHNYFLCSDSCIADSSHNHKGWNLTDLECTDITYDSCYWTEIISPIVFVEDTQYYITDNGYLMQRTGDGTVRMIQYLGYWGTSSGSYFSGAYAGLALYNGCLYYNNATTIYQYNLSDHTISNFYVPDTSSGKIYGMMIEGSTLSYSIQSKPSTPERTIYETALPEIVEPVVLGDVNGDESIDVLDGQKVLAYTENNIVLDQEELEAADVNQDEVINEEDVEDILDYTVGNITEF